MTTPGPLPVPPPAPDPEAMTAEARRLTGEVLRLSRRWQYDPAGTGADLGSGAASAALDLAALAGPVAAAIAGNDPGRAVQLRGLAASLRQAAARYAGHDGHDVIACAALLGLLTPAIVLTGRACRPARARETGTATPHSPIAAAAGCAWCAPGAPCPDCQATADPAAARPGDGHRPSGRPGEPCRICGGAVTEIRWSETAGFTAVIHDGEITAIYASYGQDRPGRLDGETDQPLDELLTELRAAGRDHRDDASDRYVEQVTEPGGSRHAGGH